VQREPLQTVAEKSRKRLITPNRVSLSSACSCVGDLLPISQVGSVGSQLPVEMRGFLWKLRTVKCRKMHAFSVELYPCPDAWALLSSICDSSLRTQKHEAAIRVASSSTNASHSTKRVQGWNAIWLCNHRTTQFAHRYLKITFFTLQWYIFEAIPHSFDGTFSFGNAKPKVSAADVLLGGVYYSRLLHWRHILCRTWGHVEQKRIQFKNTKPQAKCWLLFCGVLLVGRLLVL
jgi:hypothetical protein